MAFAQKSEALTAGDVLGLPKAEQGRLIAGWIGGMGALLHTYGHKDKAQCVWNWPDQDNGKNRALLAASFEKYADQDPVAVLLALLQRDCGALLPHAQAG